MARILWIELRRSTFTVGVAVLAVAQVLLMLNTVDSWQGVWPEASAAVGAPWLFLGAAASALSAFDALERSKRRQGNDADGPVWRSEVSAMLVARVVQVVAVLIAGIACAVVVNLNADAPSGSLWTSYLLVALSFAIESVALGLLFGSLGGPLWFAPLAAALVTFLRAAWFQGAPSGAPEAAFTRIFLAGHPWLELNSYAVACALAEAAVVAAVALLAPSVVARVRMRRAGRVYPRGKAGTLRALVPLAVILVGVPMVVSSPPIVEPRNPPAQPTCSQSEPVICVWSEDAALLPKLTETASRANAIAEGVGGSLGTRYDEYGLSDADNFVPTGPGTWPFSGDLGMAIAYSLAPNECAPPPNDPTMDTYYGALWEMGALFQLQIEGAARPSNYGDSTGVDMGMVTDVWRSGRTESDAWIDERITTMKTISLAWCG